MRRSALALLSLLVLAGCAAAEEPDPEPDFHHPVPAPAPPLPAEDAAAFSGVGQLLVQGQARRPCSTWGRPTPRPTR